MDYGSHTQQQICLPEHKHCKYCLASSCITEIKCTGNGHSSTLVELKSSADLHNDPRVFI